MNDHFPYIYAQGHWLREYDEDDLTLGGVVETVLCFFAMAVCWVAVMMLWLCG